MIVATIVVPTTSFAEEVQLKFRNGSTTVTGELVEYRDCVYKLETALGPISISAELDDCLGGNCPSDDHALLDLEDVGQDFPHQNG
jgi:hypothetical protein